MTITEIKVRRSTSRGQVHSKIYVFPTGETLLQNLENRRIRPYDLYKKEVIPQVIDGLSHTDPGLSQALKAAKIRWSQTCGCACGCSPGFTAVGTGLPVDVYVTVQAG